MSVAGFGYGSFEELPAHAWMCDATANTDDAPLDETQAQVPDDFAFCAYDECDDPAMPDSGYCRLHQKTPCIDCGTLTHGRLCNRCFQIVKL